MTKSSGREAIQALNGLNGIYRAGANVGQKIDINKNDSL